MYTHARACTGVRAHTHTHAHIQSHTHTHTHTQCVHMYAHACMHAHMHTHTHTGTHPTLGHTPHYQTHSIDRDWEAEMDEGGWMFSWNWHASSSDQSDKARQFHLPPTDQHVRSPVPQHPSLPHNLWLSILSIFSSTAAMPGKPRNKRRHDKAEKWDSLLSKVQHTAAVQDPQGGPMVSNILDSPADSCVSQPGDGKVISGSSNTFIWIRTRPRSLMQNHHIRELISTRNP